MKIFFTPLVIIMILAFPFGYFGYQVNSFVNIPLVIANITGLSAFVLQRKSKEQVSTFKNEPGHFHPNEENKQEIVK